MVLYLGSLGKSERLRIFNPKPLVARERWATLTEKSVKMRFIIKIQLLFLITTLSSCGQNKSSEIRKIGTSENILKESEVEIQNPKANIEELEMEVNNGGFNQYFINSGQNCYETLKELKRNKKMKLLKYWKKQLS
jgi:hypothetical protein